MKETWVSVDDVAKHRGVVSATVYPCVERSVERLARAGGRAVNVEPGVRAAKPRWEVDVGAFDLLIGRRLEDVLPRNVSSTPARFTVWDEPLRGAR